MDDNELIEWLRTSGSDLDPCLDAADTIERLQRDKSELVHQHNALMKAVRAEQERAEKAERERDEARAELASSKWNESQAWKAAADMEAQRNESRSEIDELKSQLAAHEEWNARCPDCGRTHFTLLEDKRCAPCALSARITVLQRERDEALAERDKLRDVLLSKHGGEPLALLDELDEARAERDIALKALSFYARREHMTGEPWSEWEWAEADSSNWLTPPTDEGMAVENGAIARAALGEG